MSPELKSRRRSLRWLMAVTLLALGMTMTPELATVAYGRTDCTCNANCRRGNCNCQGEECSCTCTVILNRPKCSCQSMLAEED